MKSAVLTALLVVAAGAGVVRAGGESGWVPADEAVEASPDDYQLALDEGDEAAMLAASESASPATIKKLVNLAARAYERAAKARPDAAEPHWRAGAVLFGFFVDCDPRGALCQKEDAKIHRRILGHWRAFEDKAPLDPRVVGILFERAILHTKLATRDGIAAAIADYQALLDRKSTEQLDLGTILGNLAESHMMLGDLDQAIERYEEAMQNGGSIAVHYGLAVAYDRDGQGAKAKEIFTAWGEDQFDEWRAGIEASNSDTFYVPEGEVHYYLALGYEALGRDREATRAWKRFLDAGAHSGFQPRARAHLGALAGKKK